MTTTRLTTAEDLWQMPGDGYHRYELVAGELIRMPPAGGEHGEIGFELGGLIRAYLDAGAQMVWLVYPKSRSVSVYTADRTSRILTEDEDLDGGDVLPGFRVPVREIFA